MNLDDANDMFTDQDIQKYASEVLFWVQGIGKSKRIQDIDVFVKGDKWEENLKDVNRFLRNDEPKNPIIRRMLEDWNFMEDCLLPLLISQNQDIKLSFYAILLIAELTYPVDKEAKEYGKMVEVLQKYKKSFLAPNIVKTLADHLASCCRGENEISTDKNNQLIELIVVIFKNLLQVPKVNTIKDNAFSLLLLRRFRDEGVLDSFVFMTQKVDSEFSK